MNEQTEQFLDEQMDQYLKGIGLINWSEVANAFDELVTMQREISTLAGYDAINPTKHDIVEAGFALCNEVNEFIDELDWKRWKESTIDSQLVAGEFADVMAFFLLNAALACDRAGLTPLDLIIAYCDKSLKNVRRMFGKSGEAGYNGVAK